MLEDADEATKELIVATKKLEADKKEAEAAKQEALDKLRAMRSQ